MHDTRQASGFCHPFSVQVVKMHHKYVLLALNNVLNVYTTKLDLLLEDILRNDSTKRHTEKKNRLQDTPLLNSSHLVRSKFVVYFSPTYSEQRSN